MAAAFQWGMDFGQLADDATYDSAEAAATVGAAAGGGADWAGGAAAAAGGGFDWAGSAAAAVGTGAASAGEGASASASASDLFAGQYGEAFQPSRGTPDQEGDELDLEGTIDQALARVELSSRFEIVPDGTTGHAHNQVTQEEYDRICRTYSDVRLGRGDLTIDTGEMTDKKQAQDYRDAMLGNVADMMMTTSGRKQVMGLSNNVARDDAGVARLDAEGEEVHHHTTIRALYHDANKDLDHTNDGHDPRDYERDYAATAPTANTDEADDAQYRRSDAERGEGTNATIWMSPGSPAPRIPDDVTLAHEMQHALHMTQGTLADGRWKGPGPDDGVDNAERQALGLDYFGTNRHDPVGCSENTYRRERNTLGRGPALPLRTNYNDAPP